MKHVAPAFAFALFALLLTASPAHAGNCSCSAPDGSCSASVTCPEGCWAWCQTDGVCKAGCEGGGAQNGPRQDDPNPFTAPGTISSTLIDPVPRLDLHAVDVTADDLASLLADSLDSEVRFLPLAPGETYSIDVVELPAEDLVAALARVGVVAVGGDAGTGSRGAAAGGDAEITIRIEDATMGVIADLLGQLVAGAGMTVRVADPSRPFGLDVQRMPLDELLAALETVGAIELDHGSPR